ncbi:hypothetical protein GE09DRAFT_1151561 [Coniochaeta sp. 2T2.1]|nr:hypothetical protein GE09DRAFT_1151561 [Coniochaeta sp. 2T2.1]
MGQSIGVAISSVLFQNVFRRRLQGIPAFVALVDEYSRDATYLLVCERQSNMRGRRGPSLST